MKHLLTLIILLFSVSQLHAQYQVKSAYLQNPALAIGYVDSCASFWLHAYDSTYGGFYTNMDKTPVQYSAWGTQKNLQTQSRDAYGFVRAFQLTGNDLYLYKARQALTFMYAHAWDNTNGGWYWELDNKGNPTSNNTTKDAFHQLYALLGPMAFFEATRDSSQWAWAMKGYANNETKLWDARPDYFGYYNSATPNWATKTGKSFNSTVDAITTHLLHFYIMTGDPTYSTRMLQIANNMQNHLVASMSAQSIGFCEGYDANWGFDPKDTMTIMGHILKTAWCFLRVNEFFPDTHYVSMAKALANHVLARGYDSKLGGPYKDFNRKNGQMLMWGIADTAKAWWQMEQAVTSGLFLYRVTGNQTYLQMADETLSFFMKYFVDHVNGEVYENRTRYGGQAWGEQKGDGNKGGYHSIELGYYTYLYGNFFLQKQPFTLYYSINPANADRNIALSPIEIPSASYQIKEVTKNGATFTDFNAAARTIHLAANESGKFKVTFQLTNAAGIAGEATRPAAFSLEQNYPNPFNPTTMIAYHLAAHARVSLKIYDFLGKEVATLVSTEQDAGNYSVPFNGTTLASGVYFYTLRAGNYVVTKKMMLMK